MRYIIVVVITVVVAIFVPNTKINSAQVRRLMDSFSRLLHTAKSNAKILLAILNAIKLRIVQLSDALDPQNPILLEDNKAGNYSSRLDYKT